MKIDLKEINKYSYVTEVVLYVSLRIIGSANLNLSLSSQFNRINNILEIMILGCLIINVMVNTALFGLTNRKIIFLLVSLPLLIGIALNSGTLIIMLFLFILGYPSGLNSVDLSKHVYRTIICITLLIIFLSMIGVLNDAISLRLSGQIRHSFGFADANTLGNIVIITLLLKLYSSWKKWRLKDRIIWGVIIGITFVYINSRMSFFLSIVLLLILLMYKRNYISVNLKKNLYKLPFILFIIGAVLTVVITFYFDFNKGKLYIAIDNMSSHRLYYMLTFFENYGIHWWGNSAVQFITRTQERYSGGYLTWMGLDNSYMFILIRYGIICLFLIALMYYFAEKNVEKSKNFGGLLYLIAFAIIGLTENYMMNIALNFSFFIFAEYLNERN